MEPGFKRDQDIDRHGCIIAVMVSGGYARHISGCQGLLPSHTCTSLDLYKCCFHQRLLRNDTRICFYGIVPGTSDHQTMFRSLSLSLSLTPIPMCVSLSTVGYYDDKLRGSTQLTLD